MHNVQYCTLMARTAPDLVTSAEAREMLGGRRLEPYYRLRPGCRPRVTPVMRAGSGARSPLLFNRKDIEKLRDEIEAELREKLQSVSGTNGSKTGSSDRRLSAALATPAKPRAKARR